MSKVAIIDDSNPAIEYTEGAWSGVDHAFTSTSNEYNSTMHYTFASGTTIRYTFRGTGITVYGTINQPKNYGLAVSTYRIDNNPAVSFNASGEVAYPNQEVTFSHIPFYKSPTLSYGEHTILITISNVDSAANRRYIFDFFTVTGMTEDDMARAGAWTIVDDRDPSISYNGAWLMVSNSAEYAYTSRRTPQGVNATATLSFTGDSISVYGTIYNDYGSVPIVAFLIDPGTPNQVYRDTGVRGLLAHRFSQPLLILSGLSDGPHTMQLIALGDRAPSWWLDYFVYGSSRVLTGVAGGNSGGGGGMNTATAETDTLVGVTTRTTMITTGGTVMPEVQTISNFDPGLPQSGGNGATVQSGPSVSSSSPSIDQPTGLPVAAIIGASIGSVGLLVIIAFIVFYLRRKHKKVRSPHLSPSEGDYGALKGSATPEGRNSRTLAQYPFGTQKGVRPRGSRDGEQGIGRAQMELRPLNQRSDSPDNSVFIIPPEKYRPRNNRTEVFHPAASSSGSERRTSVGTSHVESRDSYLRPPGLSDRNRTESSRLSDSVTPETEPESRSERNRAGRQEDMVPDSRRGREEWHESSQDDSVYLSSDIHNGHASHLKDVPRNSASTSSRQREQPIPERTRRVPVREVDAGIRLDHWTYDDDDVPDTLPPSYSNYG